MAAAKLYSSACYCLESRARKVACHKYCVIADHLPTPFVYTCHANLKFTERYLLLDFLKAVIKLTLN